MKKAYIALAIIVCTMSACSLWSGGDESSVKSFVAEYAQAANDRDEEKLASMYVYPQQAASALKFTIEYLKEMDKEGVRVTEQMDVTKVEVHDDVAVADMIVNMKYSGDSPTASMYQMFSAPSFSMRLTLKRSRSTWKILKEDKLE